MMLAQIQSHSCPKPTPYSLKITRFSLKSTLLPPLCAWDNQTVDAQYVVLGMGWLWYLHRCYFWMACWDIALSTLLTWMMRERTSIGNKFQKLQCALQYQAWKRRLDNRIDITMIGGVGQAMSHSISATFYLFILFFIIIIASSMVL